MANPFLVLRSLLPGPSIVEGQVSSVESDGTVIVTTVNGGTMRCTTAITVLTGQTVSIEEQRIIEIIDNLTTYDITI